MERNGMSEQVTKEQCEFYRALYDEEERTSLQLEGRAKVYLSIISAFLAAMILKAADAKGLADTLHIRWGLMLLDALPMSLALFLVLWSLRIRRFEAANDGPRLIEIYANTGWPTADQFNGDRVADYAAASHKNRLLNNQTSALLEWASWFMAIGIIYLLGIVIYAIWRA
jgi:hypothetical protein